MWSCNYFFFGFEGGGSWVRICSVSSWRVYAGYVIYFFFLYPWNLLIFFTFILLTLNSLLGAKQRDEVGIGGSFEDFIAYVRAAFGSENVKMVLYGPASEAVSKGKTPPREPFSFANCDEFSLPQSPRCKSLTSMSKYHWNWTARPPMNLGTCPIIKGLFISILQNVRL